MLAYTYKEHGKFELQEKPKPEILDSRDAIVHVALGSICTSDPRATIRNYWGILPVAAASSVLR